MLHTDKSTLLPKLLAILVTVSGVVLLSWQVHQLYLQMTQLAIAAPAPPTRQPAGTPPQLLQRLFGRPDDVRAADLRGVVLLGCIVAASPAQSQALVRIEGQGALTVVPGDEFLPGVTVREVAHDHLLFTRNGSSGRLDFAAHDSSAAQGELR